MCNRQRDQIQSIKSINDSIVLSRAETANSFFCLFKYNNSSLMYCYVKFILLIIIFILTKTSVAFFRSLITYLMECLYNCLILSKSTFVIVYSTRYLIKICTMLQVKGRGNTRCSVSIAFVKPASHEHDIECHWQDPSFHRPIQPHVIAVRSPPAYLSVIFRTGVSSGSLRIS